MTTTTRAVVVAEHGGPEVLRVHQVPEPSPGPGQVRIVTAVTSVNFADVHARRGGHAAAESPPFIPGLDCVGTIDVLGEGVTGLTVGQRVCAWTDGGSYSEEVLANATLTYPLEEGVPVEAAASLTVLVTAHNVLERGQVEAGDVVLVHAATGGIGAAAVQMAVARGARAVIASVGGEVKARAATALGATHVIDHTREDVPTQVREMTAGRGVDMIVDTLGGFVTEQSMTILAPFGRLVICGHTAGPAATLLSTELHRQNRSVLGYSTGHQRRTRPHGLKPAVDQVLRAATEGHLRVVVAARLPLHQAPDGHTLVEGRTAVGRVLLDTHS